MNPIWIPVAVTAAAGVFLVSQHRAAPLPPGTPPGTQPGTNPAVPADTAGVLAEAQTIIAQAVANPRSVRPDRIGFLAQQLRAAGRPDEAARLESVGPSVCAAQGLDAGCWMIRIQGAGTPAAKPPPVQASAAAVLDPQQAAARARLDEQAFLAIADAEAGLRNGVPPGQINERGLEQLITALRAAGLNDRADQASTAAGRVLGATEGFAVPPNPNPSTLTGDLLAGVTTALAPGSPTGSKRVAVLLRVLNLVYPSGFLAEKQALQQRVTDLVAQGR